MRLILAVAPFRLLEKRSEEPVLYPAKIFLHPTAEFYIGEPEQCVFGHKNQVAYPVIHIGNKPAEGLLYILESDLDSGRDPDDKEWLGTEIPDELTQN